MSLIICEKGSPISSPDPNASFKFQLPLELSMDPISSTCALMELSLDPRDAEALWWSSLAVSR